MAPRTNVTIIFAAEMNYDQHPLSKAFPAMSSEEYESLKQSIDVIGVQNPIVIYEEMIIDGWHRYRAARELGMDCPVITMGLDVCPRDFVLAQNKMRRHITAAQLAMATTEVYRWHQVGKPNSAGTAELSKTSKELAKIAGTGTRVIEQAKKIQRDAASQVQEAVKRGEIGLGKAVAISKMPLESQVDAIAKPLPRSNPIEEPDDEVGDFAPDEKELEETNASIKLTLEMAQKILDSDDPLAMLVEENRQLANEVKILTVSCNGYMNDAAALCKEANYWKRRAKKAERSPT